MTTVSSQAALKTVPEDMQNEQNDVTREDRICWTPSDEKVNNSILYDYMRYIFRRTDKNFSDYSNLWQWSVENKEGFWDSVWDYCGVIGDKGSRIFDDNNGRMFGSQELTI